jgi:uncharacterized protein (TIGR02444 family)
MTSRVSLSFWRFAKTIYAGDGMAEACLTLQDAQGADITLLLFAFFCGADGRGRLDAAQLTRAIGVVQPWQDGVVAPLRAIRRAMREPIGAILDEALRHRIKRIEFAAERRQIDVLSGLLPSARQGVSLQTRLSDAAWNVSAYLSLLPGQAKLDTPPAAHRLVIERLTNAFVPMTNPSGTDV